jgi:hypothetical protein
MPGGREGPYEKLLPSTSPLLCVAAVLAAAGYQYHITGALQQEPTG